MNVHNNHIRKQKKYSNLEFKSCLSVDVEDAINVSMKNNFGIEIPPTKRVVENTLRLLELLTEKNVVATFFILGEVAKTFPSLVKEIAKNGHEIGIHGYNHTKLFNTSSELALKEIGLAKQIVEDISGKQVYGYRAPFFSINEKTTWVFEVLRELGFIYDSSVIDSACLKGFEVISKKRFKIIKLSDKNSIIEIPPSSRSIFGHVIPVCGGGYLRTFPFFITKILFKQILKKQPVIIYTHPYEIDVDPPQEFYRNRINKSSIKTKFLIAKSRYNRINLLGKISYLIDNNSFVSLIDLIKQEPKYPVL